MSKIESSESEQRPASPGTEAPKALISNPFRYYFRMHRKTFVLGLLFLLGTNICDAVTPKIVGYALDQIAGGDQYTNVAKTIGVLVLVTIFLSAFRYLWRVFWGRFHHSVAEDLRNHIFNRYTDLGPKFFSKTSVGELMSLINNDVNLFRMAIGPGILILVDALFIVCIIPPLMISISPSWTWKTLILMPAIPFVVRALMTKIREGYKKQQDRFAEMSGTSQEVVSGIRVIKSYSQEENQTKLYNKISKRYELSSNEVAKLESFWTPTMELGVTVGSVILLVIGAPEVMRNSVTVGSYFAFYQYIQRMVWPMTAIGLGMNFIQKGRGSFDRIKALLETIPDVPNVGLRTIETFESLEVRNLTFTYPDADEPAITNLSFTIKKGETIGIVGAIGSGKSTIIELICREYAVPTGTILLNGVSIEQYRREDLMNLMGVVPQEAFLFSRKLKDNIAFGDRDWEFEQVEDAVRFVNFEDEIEKIPDGYEALLGEKGVNLSGGQKQRLTMARALIRKSEVLILDDSLSAVDAETEKKILETLKGSTEGATTAIIVSHRLASLRWADKVLVLDQGKAEAFGPHSDLLRDSRTYKSLYSLQTEVTQ